MRPMNNSVAYFDDEAITLIELNLRMDKTLASPAIKSREDTSCGRDEEACRLHLAHDVGAMNFNGAAIQFQVMGWRY